ncbi:MAG: galactokinase [Bacteroidota bacterium]|nr:galactokinase [Bacteroidota bacterium]
MNGQSGPNTGKVLDLVAKFEKVFHSKPLVIRAPGRINIIGEHTDYNEGFVLPAAIDKAAYLAMSLREDEEIHLVAADLDETFSVRLSELKPVQSPSWPNYLLGVAAQFQNSGLRIRGFNAILSSEVPMGAGLSSSAAVECATAFALNTLLEAGLSRMEMVKLAQKAEHEYAGVMCGIMDQFASMMGKKDHVIKLDCRSLEYEHVPFRLEGIKILLLDSNVKHSLASSEYNVRRKECSQAVDWIREQVPTVHSLRDVTEAMLNTYVLPRDPLIDRRSRFVVLENKRLEEGCRDLENGNFEALGKKMFETHHGLSAQYEVSCRELDFLISQVEGNPDVIGARMMGGGFGGCTINLVRENALPALVATVSGRYLKETGKALTPYVVSIEQGTSRVY